jgi:hypothetical protein
MSDQVTQSQRSGGLPNDPSRRATRTGKLSNQKRFIAQNRAAKIERDGERVGRAMSCARPAAHQPAAGLVKANGTVPLRIVGRPRVVRPRRAWDAPRTSVGLSTYRGRRQRCSFGQQWSIHFIREVGKIFLKFM